MNRSSSACDMHEPAVVRTTPSVWCVFLQGSAGTALETTTRYRSKYVTTVAYFESSSAYSPM